MAVNPYGAVFMQDFGAPKVITGYAMSGLAAGQLVFASGATGVVSSGLDSFVSSDIKWAPGASGANFTGVVIQAGSSGTAVPVAIEGVFILQSIGTTTAGQVVAAGGDDSVAVTTTAGHEAGRALTTAASGTFAVVQIK